MDNTSDDNDNNDDGIVIAIIICDGVGVGISDGGDGQTIFHQ